MFILLELLSFVVWIAILVSELSKLESLVNAPYDYGKVVAAVMWLVVTLVVGVVGMSLTRRRNK